MGTVRYRWSKMSLHRGQKDVTSFYLKDKHKLACGGGAGGVVAREDKRKLLGCLSRATSLLPLLLLLRLSLLFVTEEEEYSRGR